MLSEDETNPSIFRSLLNTYQGKRAYHPLQRFNDIEERMMGKRGGRGRFSLRSMRPNSLLTVYSTAGPKQRRSDPAMMQFEEGEDDGDSEIEEETAEPVEVRTCFWVYELFYDLSKTNRALL